MSHVRIPRTVKVCRALTTHVAEARVPSEVEPYESEQE